jgi:hypothetical protein
MHFRTIGRIFDPREHGLFTNLRQYAQSPQAIVFDDYVRIFFATREKDSDGMYVSFPAFVDMDLMFQEVLRVSTKPVVDLGERGCFDEHGIFPFSPIRVEDKLFAYTTGWTRRKSVATDSGIGLAISSDGGDSFVKQGQGPILGPSLHEPFLVSDGFAIRHMDLFHMWYIYGQRWIYESQGAAPDRVYKIAHAVSLDGRRWSPSSRCVLDDWLGVDECQALPSVIRHGDCWHMVFCYRNATDFRRNPDRAYRLGYASSIDLIDWKRSELQLTRDRTSTGWDSDMQCYPNFVQVNGQLFLLYNGNEFGRYGFGLARLI